MAQLYKRAVLINVDGLSVADLRVTFRVHKTLGKEPNTCAATVTNLSERSRALIRKKGATVALYAGYGNELSLLFSGDARLINHVHDRPNWTTKIECGDGETLLLNARVSESFSADTKWKDIAKAIARKFVKDPGDLDTALKDASTTFLNGHTVHGRAAAEFDKLMKGRDLQWSVQDGRLQVLGPSDVNADSVIVLSADSGLVGSPEFGSSKEKNGPDVLKCKALLIPGIRPGGRLRIDSRQVKGTFRVSEVTHSGDTHGADWYTEIEATAHNGS